MDDKALIDWLLRIIGILGGAIGGYMWRETRKLQRAVYNNKHQIERVKFHVIQICDKLKIKWWEPPHD